MNNLLCKRCERILPSERFRPDARYKRGFCSWCHECHRERNREWYAANKDRQNAKSRQWRKENLDKAREISRNFHCRNKEARANQHAEWVARNRDRKNAASAKRKAAKLMATPRWANLRRIRAIYSEAKKLQEYTGIPHHVDHIVPLQGENVCGLHCESNLQIIPAAENCAKRNKWDARIEEAYRQGDLFLGKPTPAAPVQEPLL